MGFGKATFELDSPLEMTIAHSMFHVSMLRKFVGDSSSIIPLEEVIVEDNVTYKEVSIEIFYQ